MSEINNNYCRVVRIYYDEEKTMVDTEYFKMNGKIEGVYKRYHRNGQLCL
jgi:hypothetical protein